KAIDHEVEGPHTVIGGELLKRYGFSQNVIDGVVGHHGDVEPVTMVGTLISAADAISAARPGARSEIVSNYIQRLTELEGVANTSKSVPNVALRLRLLRPEWGSITSSCAGSFP